MIIIIFLIIIISNNFEIFGSKRLLQLNLVNSSGQPWEPDSLTLYDGDIYNVTSTVIARVVSTTTGPGMDNQLYRTKKPSLSLKFHSSGADGLYGFIAEVITLPVAAIGFGQLTHRPR